MVSERTLEELNDYLDEVSSVNERMGTERFGGQIFPKIVSVEEIRQVSSKLKPKIERLINSIKKYCEIVPGSTLPNIPLHFREGFKAFGRAGAESLQIAKERDAVLWTDDTVISQLASREMACKCAWTQIACRQGVCRDNPEVFRQISLGLLSLKYDATNFTFEDAVWAAEQARWNINTSPFAAVIECFARPTIPIEPLLGLAATLLKSVWSSPADGLQASEFTQRLLDRLGAP